MTMEVAERFPKGSRGQRSGQLRRHPDIVISRMMNRSSQALRHRLRCRHAEHQGRAPCRVGRGDRDPERPACGQLSGGRLGGAGPARLDRGDRGRPARARRRGARTDLAYRRLGAGRRRRAARRRSPAPPRGGDLDGPARRSPKSLAVEGRLGADAIYAVTGLNCDAGHSAPKMRWLLDRLEERPRHLVAPATLVTGWLSAASSRTTPMPPLRCSTT